MTKNNKTVVVTEDMEFDGTRMVLNRTSREVDESSFMDRQFEERMDESRFNRGTLWFDTKLVPEGWQWGWVVEKIHMVPTENSFSQAKGKGWRPIPANKYKELMYLWTDNNREPIASDIYSIGGQVLCEREIAYKHAEDRYNTRASNDLSKQTEGFVSSNGLQRRVSTKYSNRPLDFDR